ncbi:RNA polymerase sigma factor [Saccharicrinis aurantiacus]|uniref:RNA polymerase sigma factor n=1 Tax=Saccharicrinis aurantiacus TaxID=1849719 RepID=UPI00095027E9|nr:sigma-70 family RNA polymerase sigma factor [Saccharicrinis aurantiacus]
MEASSEKSLIQKYKKSNSVDLVSELYKPYMPLVYGVCLKYLSNKEDAQDAVMNIFEKLLVELKKQDIPNDFKVWLYVVSKNFCLMKLRSDKSKNKAFEKMSSTIMENGFTQHPIDEEENPDLSEALLNCIKKLKEEQKKAIELFYFKKACYKDIAEQLEVDEKKVKSNIQNGKRNLKICIEDSKGEGDYE